MNEILGYANGRVGRNLSVRITIRRDGMACEWNPEVPTRLSAREAARYRRIRDDAVAMVARHFPCMVFEV